jgi:hypothetical protein
MSDCCTPRGYASMFSERGARAQVRRYRRRGLLGVSRRLVGLLPPGETQGRSLLEVGGGAGTLQVELLRAGVAESVSVELTPTHERAATELLREAGLTDRVERRVFDFARGADQVAAADIVVLNRVVCCYPDMPLLVAAAADHARRLMVLSFPNARWWTRLTIAVGNLALRSTRRQFRVFAHSPSAILETAAARGLVATRSEPGFFWQVARLQRTAGAGRSPLA